MKDGLSEPPMTILLYYETNGYLDKQKMYNIIMIYLA